MDESLRSRAVHLPDWHGLRRVTPLASPIVRRRRESASLIVANQIQCQRGRFPRLWEASLPGGSRSAWSGRTTAWLGTSYPLPKAGRSVPAAARVGWNSVQFARVVNKATRLVSVPKWLLGCGRNCGVGVSPANSAVSRQAGCLPHSETADSQTDTRLEPGNGSRAPTGPSLGLPDGRAARARRRSVAQRGCAVPEVWAVTADGPEGFLSEQHRVCVPS